MNKFNNKTLERYSRQIIMEKVGIEGQEKIMNTSISIIGCGGLGTTAAQYLTMSGIGEILLVDDDSVCLSNLNRQTLFSEKDLGGNKAEVLKKSLKKINPKSKLISQASRINKRNISKFLEKYSIILDCSDNFETRYLVNQYAFQKKKILVSCALQNFDIQVYTFSSWNNEYNPCYECIFPKDISRNTRSCDELGIIAPVAGMGGIFQANAVINIILNKNKQIFREIILYDCFERIFKKIQISKNSKCKICKL